MARPAETGTAGEGLLTGPVGEAVEAGLDVGVLIGKAEAAGHGHDDVAQIGRLEEGAPAAGAMEIQHGGTTAGTQQTPHLPQAVSRIGKVAQAIGHHHRIGPTVGQAGGQGIALLPVHRQPGKPLSTAAGDVQGGGGGIDAEHITAGPYPRRQGEGEISGAAAEVDDAEAGVGLQPEQGLTLPEAVQPETEQIVEPVVLRSDRVEEFPDGLRITWSDHGEGAESGEA